VVYLIDSNSLLYQVFHAVPMMTGPAGQPTNAVYGFANDMNRLRARKPEYLICVFDPPGPTFRDTIYDQYKAHRSPMPDDLFLQKEPIRRLLAAMRIPAVEVKGYEADDVLATLAVRFAERGHDVAIATSDKDCRQVLTDRIRLYNARKDLLFGKQELLDDWGITPEQVVDLLTMTGDSVDNVPGVPGIGVKTAAKLLQEHQTLDRICLAIPTMKKSKLQENLANHIRGLELSKRLVTLDRNVPIEIDWEAWKLRDPDAKTLLDFYEETGLRRFAAELRADVAKHMEKNKQQKTLFSLDSEENEPKPLDLSGMYLEEAKWDATYELIDTPAKLTRVMTDLRKQKRFAIDLETTSLNPRQAVPIGIALCWQPGQAYYLALQGPEGQPTLDADAVWKKLRPILEDAEIAKVNQNIKYDLAVMHRQGITVRGVAGDPMLASYLLSAGDRSHNLDDLSRRHLNHSPISITTLIGTGKNQKRMDQVSTAEVAQYAGEDADIALRLAELLEAELVKHHLDKLYRDMEIPLVEVLMEMEEAGIRIDVPLLREIAVDFENQIQVLKAEIHQLAGREFNIDSPIQLREILFDELKLPSRRKTAQTGEASTNQMVLEDLAAEGYEIPRKIIQYRQIAKLKGTYVDTLPDQIEPKTGRLHCQFNQAVAATGRLSSSNPNLQNIPMRTEQGRQIRKAFLPSEGMVLLTADYSQIELRIFAHLTRDPELVRAFQENRDIHAVVAGQVFGVPENRVTHEQRRMAKTVNFGILYGLSPFGLASRLGISKDEATKFIDAYFAKYPDVVAYQDKVLTEARRVGYVATILGRRREVTGIRARSSFKMRTQPEREAINAPIQGSAAGMMKLAMLNVHRRIRDEKLPARMLLQIHDELVFEVDPAQTRAFAKIVEQEMAQAMPLSVPIGVDVSAGPNWLETEPV